MAQFGDQSPTILTVPGLGGSAPTHWQSLWEAARDDIVRADLGLWDRPHRNSWVTRLDQAIRTAQAPVVLVGHSLGCLAIAWWASLSPQPYGWPVAGALLVAPADVDRRDGPP
ncbi:MAG: serine hydrolase family protein, partial [Sphingomonadales bacterium]|nr:serine hydrolase family protein [Sphingomonadales bacterium]